MTTAATRPMTNADAEAVSALIARSWIATYGPLMGPARAAEESSRRHRPDLLRSDLGRADSQSLVAESDGRRLVGYAYAVVADDTLWLDRLHVEPSHQGSGLASMLMEAVIAPWSGRCPVFLEVLKGNERAIRFYRREGFHSVEERDACGGIGGVATLIMCRAVAR